MDIFEDMRKWMGCVYVSDLPARQTEVLLLMRKIPLSCYPEKQLDDFTRYVFGMDYDSFKERFIKKN